MTSESNSLVVFFAWQSEVLKSANRRGIEASLRAAATEVEHKYVGRDLTIHIETPGKSVEEEVPFTLLSDLKIVKRKTDGHVTNQQGYFQFDRNVLENLLANYAKPLLLEEFLKIKSEIGQLIYTHIDLIMADKPRYERCSKDLFRDLGLIEVPAYHHAAHRKQALQRALKELQGILISTGAIRSATLERTKDGKDYKVVFQKGPYALATEEDQETEALPPKSGLRPVVNDYRRIKDPLIEQAEGIVRFFHKTVHDVDQHFQIKKLWIGMAAKGWRTEEPLDDQLPMERPQLLSKAIDLLKAQGVDPASHLAVALGLPELDIEQLAGLPEGALSGSAGS